MRLWLKHHQLLIQLMHYYWAMDLLLNLQMDTYFIGKDWSRNG
jgi:hypothetical protein